MLLPEAFFLSQNRLSHHPEESVDGEAAISPKCGTACIDQSEVGSIFLLCCSIQGPR